MDVVGWYVLYQKCNHKDGIQNQNFGNIPVVVCHCIDNISCDDWKNPGWGMLDNEKENGTSQRAIVSLEKRKKRAQVIFSDPAYLCNIYLCIFRLIHIISGLSFPTPLSSFPS